MNIMPSQEVLTILSFLSSLFGLIAALLAIGQVVKKNRIDSSSAYDRLNKNISKMFISMLLRNNPLLKKT